MFNLLRNHWAVLQNGYTLIATSPSVWGPVPPHLCHCLQLSLILASLAAVKWYLTVVLLCISLMSIEAEHLFTGSFANPISSLESDSSNFLLPLLNCLCSYRWVLRVFCLAWIQILYQMCVLQIFSHSLWLANSFF